MSAEPLYLFQSGVSIFFPDRQKSRGSSIVAGPIQCATVRSIRLHDGLLSFEVLFNETSGPFFVVWRQ